MRNQPSLKHFFTFAAVGLIGAACPAAASVEPYPSLVMHGESYANACAPHEKSRLRIALLKSNVRNAEQAWDAVNVILCSPPSNQNRSYIAAVVAESVKERFESTGSEPIISAVGKNSELVDDIMANGEAWDATLQASERNVILQYFKDEACVQRVNLVFRYQRWLIEEIGQACD